MALSWLEIKENAASFTKEWAGTSNEEADAKPFLIDFFKVFGISSKRVSTFEHKVKKLDNSDGYIDLLWKGTILVEMKSRGKNLLKAYEQAKDYLHGLKDHELPKYILVCDFDNFVLYDIEDSVTHQFQLNDLVNNVQHFGYLLGYQKKVYKEQDPANIKAAELMGKLHDSLEDIGYVGHPLEVYLVRILFCLFAEDTTIFNKQQFQDYIEQNTNPNGSDVASKLQELFQVLNTPTNARFKNLEEQLADFAYVNGKLFEENLPTASFDAKMRQALLNCCYIDWSKISPAIFGSMFQSVMNPKERRNLGAHYTSEKNILKVIKPLFLDELWNEFNSIKTNKPKLLEFHKKLRSLVFLDPACGCGNFLVITYRELRLLEMEVLRALYKGGQGFLNVGEIILLDVDQFYGIEYEEFPARIAEVAMWLMDHQMNMLISNEFGQYFARLPLKRAAKIVHGNALRIDWESIVDKTKLCYIIGNPPFIGYAWQSIEQKKDLECVFNSNNGFGVLDYVAAWYVKAAQIIQNTKITVGFVSTNSIIQGEQAGILWGYLFNINKIKIHFAHRTFNWKNEAKGKAAVHVVIIGFGCFDIINKAIYEYENLNGEPHEIKARNINAYLLDSKDIVIQKKSTPICNVPPINRGSDATDDGNLLLNESERDEILIKYPEASKYIRPFLMGKEFINNIPRYCLWLKDVDLSEIKGIKPIYERIQNVQNFRLSSRRVQTLKAAKTPFLFGEVRQPESNYLAIPKVSSENREYIPIGFCTKDIICGDKLFFLPSATDYHFGIVTSKMHMTWMKFTCGRMKSDFSYSNTIVYNNFPWPENPSEKQIKAIEAAAQKVLDARAEFPNSSLAALYDPLTMPPTLVKAHNDLDKAVDLAYRSQPFTSEAKRMEFLFELYEKYTADLFTVKKVKKSKK